MVKKIARRQINLLYHDTPGKTVFVAGDFNDWQPIRKLEDKNGDGVYRCRLLLVPGEYQYKFLVDDQWRSDPLNPDFIPNDFGSLNSVLTVKSK